MTRNLKALGLALVAALALGAIGAQGASAVNHSFTSPVNNTVLTGNNTGEGAHTFTGTSKDVVCTVATFSGTNVGLSRDTVTVHPKYSSCEFLGIKSVVVNTNGCNYVLGSDTTTSTHSGGNEHATVSIECEPNHHITVVAAGCTLTFSANHGGTAVNQSLHGIKYTQLASHSGKHAVTVQATVKTVHYTAIGNPCLLAGITPGTHTDGVYNGSTSVTGYEDGTASTTSTTEGLTWSSHGAQVDITVSNTA